MRLKILRIILILCFCVLGLDLAYVQVLKGNYYYNLSVNNRIRVIPLEGQRGRILDRNGEVLAENRLSFNVSVIPQDVVDQDVLFEYLSGILKLSADQLTQRFRQRRHTPFAPVVLAEDVDQKTAMVLEENKFRFPGLYIQEAFRRYYPQGPAVAHVLGYVGKIDIQKIKKLKHYGYTRQSIIGYTGVEEYYDQYLLGKEGGQQIEVNSRGRQVRLLGIREPERGRDIQLTIDSRMQQEAFRVMDGRPGSIVIMDMDSGEVLCLVSSPAYDPNVFSDAGRRREKGRLFTDAQTPMFNRAIKGQYPPGSVFKIIMAIAGLSEHKMTSHDTVHCPGYYQLGKRRFRCAHVHGDQNIVQAIGHSCNVSFYQLGLKLGPDLMHKYARNFGLGALTHIDLPSEEKGFVPSPRHRWKKGTTGWYDGDTLNFSIGQGEVLASPIQITRMMAAVATRGKIFEPHVLKQIEGEAIVATPAVRVLHLDDQVMDLVREGMRSTVVSSHGTARILNLAGFEIYGKTGTAQTVRGKDTHAWFAGYNLQGERRIAFCVFLEYGGSSYYAVRATRDLLNALRKKKIL